VLISNYIITRVSETRPPCVSVLSHGASPLKLYYVVMGDQVENSAKLKLFHRFEHGQPFLTGDSGPNTA
jgi:hypothetical protein